MILPKLPDHSIEVASAAQIDNALDQLAKSIDQHYRGEEVLLLSVMIGGLIPTAQLVLRLKTPVTLDYIHVSRYRQEQGQADLQWLAQPRTTLRGKHVLVVDDILDEGPTLKAIMAWCREQGALTALSAVLADKQHNRRVSDIHADFVGLTLPDQYVFGFGMDYRGSLRHLPAIYALHDSESTDSKQDDNKRTGADDVG